MLTADNLKELVREKLAGRLLMVVSNREPYIHTWSGDEIKCTIPASGLTVALDPVMRACGGIWVAHGSGNADRDVVNKNDNIMVPPENPQYALRRVWLSKEEEDGYYYGFSNEALWPLCHIAYTRPKFDLRQWNIYKSVNQKFAEVVLQEVGSRKALVFVQDYHLALLSKYIKQNNPEIITAQFWHIPWPNRETFRICPWLEEIIDGLLGNDLLGFHIAYHRSNFLETVDRTVECKIDYEKMGVLRGGKFTIVRPFPISVDFERISTEAARPEVEQEIELLRHKFGLHYDYIGIGVDRFDYTKGIAERLQAIDRFLERYPRYCRRFVFVQIGDVSRIHIEEYRLLNKRIDELVEAINWKYQQGAWKPIILIKEHCSQKSIQAFHRMANVCIVSSLHDGMNLVAKEFVSARVDNDGVLMLSRFTGAARELDDAILMNPYSPDEMADGIKQALEMPRDERSRRMIKMREKVAENNIYRWAASIIIELTKIGV